MKKWMVLALAVGFVLTASFSAQADSVLLPWVIKDKAISTIITLVNSQDPTQLRTQGKVRFHLLYWYKKTTNNGQTEECEEVDFCVPTSYNDILVFDAAGNFNGGSPLFGDTAVQGTKYTTVQGTSLALPVDGPRRAFLIATNEIYTTENCGFPYTYGNDQTIYAEAMVVDIANGAAWGYDGYNPRNAPAEGPYWFYDDGAGRDALGQIIASNHDEYAYLTIMPPSVFTTKIFVTPVDNDTDFNMWRGDLLAVSKLYCDINAGLGGMYDYDERCISFDTVKPVICTDASTIDHYVSSGAWTIFYNTKAEGWAYLYLPNARYFDPVKEKDYYPSRQAAVGKLEYSLGTASFDGNKISAAINNFIWLRGRTGPQTAD